MNKKKSKKLKLRLIRKNPRYVRWVENMDEFGRACNANQQFRLAFRPLLKNMADRYVSGRLSRLMLRVLQSDKIHGRGERTVVDGELQLLEHFNFNRETRLFDILSIPGYTIHFSRETGQVQVSLPAILPATFVNYPEGANQFSIHVIAAAVDFSGYSDIEPGHYSTEEISQSVTWTEPEQFTLHLPPGIHLPVFITIGIEFSKRLRSGKFMLTDKKYNAMEVVRVVSGE